MSSTKQRQIMARALGDRIRSARKARGLTQPDLARILGINGSNVSRLETGAHKSVYFATLAKLSTVLGLSVPEMFEPKQ